MAQAARAILIHGDKMLLMRRNKQGSDYYTLVGGKINSNETPEQGLRREVKEETGLDISSARLVFTEKHPEPYNDQLIFLCEVKNFDNAAISDSSEEAFLNKIGINIHALTWTDRKHFANLPFFTMQLQKAIVEGLNNGFSDQVINL